MRKHVFTKIMADDTSSKAGRKRKLTDSERKKKKKDLWANYGSTRIYIGDQHERWNELKSTLSLKTNSEVAKFLLDSYELNGSARKRPETVRNVIEDMATTSTPGPTIHRIKIPAVSDITTSESDMASVASALSGVELLQEKKSIMMEKSIGFINPFDLTMEVSESNFEADDHMSDEDYEPSLNLSLRPDSNICLEDAKEEDDTNDEDDDSDQPEIEELDIWHIRTVDDTFNFVGDSPFLVYYSALLSLAKTNVPLTCRSKGCGTEISVCRQVVGSALYLTWVCENGHCAKKWCSQPLVNRQLHGGDLLLASTILLSGSNFQKMVMFSKFLNLPILSSTTFHKIQRTYLIPSIDQYWIDHQEHVLQSLQGKEVVILGDGRMDSPGHSAQYCTYTFMENSSKKIVCIITMDKRVTDRKSTNLEKACFVKGLNFLKEKKIKIVEVVTDSHLQITALMKKDFPEIKHSHDVWHGAKNLGKKIIKAGQEKQNRKLLEWTKDVVNHFWHCAQISDTREDFTGVWRGILHHVVNEHEWLLPHGPSGTNECNHGPLPSERSKEWLKKDSPPHVALRRIVLDKRLLNRIPYYLNFRSTAELENFQNLILLYASKRHSYKPPAFRARNLLAALDHNNHVDRDVIVNRDGTTRYQRSFNKKSGRWSANPKKADKQYLHIPEIIMKILKMRLNDKVGMNQPVVLEKNDPRRISAVLAPIPPPPTEEIVTKQKSCFKLK